MPFSHTKSSTAPIDLFGTFMKGFVAHKAFLHALSYKTPVIQTMGDGEEGGLGKASHFINKQSEPPLVMWGHFESLLESHFAY